MKDFIVIVIVTALITFSIFNSSAPALIFGVMIIAVYVIVSLGVEFRAIDSHIKSVTNK